MRELSRPGVSQVLPWGVEGVARLKQKREREREKAGAPCSRQLPPHIASAIAVGARP